MGSILAETRTAAGRTIDQVSAATKIRSAIVRAIEADDFSACGGDFYARAHVKSIARYLGLDPAPLLERFDTQSGHADVPVAQMFDVDALAGRPERRGPNWSAAMATALAVVLLYGIVQVLAGPGTSRPGRAARRGGDARVRALTRARHLGPTTRHRREGATCASHPRAEGEPGSAQLGVRHRLRWSNPLPGGPRKQGAPYLHRPEGSQARRRQRRRPATHGQRREPRRARSGGPGGASVFRSAQPRHRMSASARPPSPSGWPTCSARQRKRLLRTAVDHAETGCRQGQPELRSLRLRDSPSRLVRHRALAIA